MGRYSVQGTATWGTVLVMTGVDAKTATPVCLKVTSHPPRFWMMRTPHHLSDVPSLPSSASR